MDKDSIVSLLTVFPIYIHFFSGGSNQLSHVIFLVLTTVASISSKVTLTC